MIYFFDDAPMGDNNDSPAEGGEEATPAEGAPAEGGEQGGEGEASA